MRRFRIFYLSLFVTANITVCFITLFFNTVNFCKQLTLLIYICLLYTSDAADEL